MKKTLSALTLFSTILLQACGSSSVDSELDGGNPVSVYTYNSSGQGTGILAAWTSEVGTRLADGKLQVRGKQFDGRIAVSNPGLNLVPANGIGHADAAAHFSLARGQVFVEFVGGDGTVYDKKFINNDNGANQEYSITLNGPTFTQPVSGLQVRIRPFHSDFTERCPEDGNPGQRCSYIYHGDLIVKDTQIFYN